MTNVRDYVSIRGITTVLDKTLDLAHSCSRIEILLLEKDGITLLEDGSPYSIMNYQEEVIERKPDVVEASKTDFVLKTTNKLIKDLILRVSFMNG